VVFSSLVFLCLFFPLQMILYTLARGIEAKNTVLILFSLVFYAWGEPFYILILLVMAFLDWLISQFIYKYRGTGKSKAFLVLGCFIDLGLLAFFKYGVFVTTNLQKLTGFPEVIPKIALPIGISFYTFQLLSYMVDVYRQEVPAQPHFRRLLLYVSLFHQCIAGPIVRYKDVSEQILSRHVTGEDMRNGINRFASGLAKKVLLANVCGKIASLTILDGQLANQAANLAVLERASSLSLWIGCLAYMMQIYLDFSAYSDMAIGMGLMVGFRYKENFNYPYLARSITDFWRRWHMSLSSFFRDYVYIPLGGNRKGKPRQAFNLFVVWLLTGMWHGADWNFILWGLYYFVFLALEKFLIPGLQRLPAFFGHLYTLIVVFFSWILFYFSDFTQGWVVIKGLFCLNGNPFTTFESTNILLNYFIFLIVAAIACTPLPRLIYHRICSSTNTGAMVLGSVMEWIFPVAGLLLSISFLVGDAYNPFLYLQF
jgi:alginate O-acetyltransferase complex protein AlgI